MENPSISPEPQTTPLAPEVSTNFAAAASVSAPTAPVAPGASPTPPAAIVSTHLPPKIPLRLELRLPIPARYSATLEAFGFQGILELIISGHSMTAIAGMLGMGPGGPAALCNYLQQSDHPEQVRAALERSSELILDNITHELEAVDKETVTPAAVALYKLQVDLAQKKAAQRNARYRSVAPKEDAQDGQPQQRQAPTFQIVIAPGATAAVGVIETINGQRADRLDQPPIEHE